MPILCIYKRIACISNCLEEGHIHQFFIYLHEAHLLSISASHLAGEFKDLLTEKKYSQYKGRLLIRGNLSRLNIVAILYFTLQFGLTFSSSDGKMDRI